MTEIIKEIMRHTGFWPSDIVRISRDAPRSYKVFSIPKQNGSSRTIAQPTKELKAIQRAIVECLRKILPAEHTTATAYVKGKSIIDNAKPHRNSRIFLKTDFQNFFPSIMPSHFDQLLIQNEIHWEPEICNLIKRLLFFGNRTSTPQCLAIGAPSSPYISNAIMYQFDLRFSQYCASNELIYTRYADDVTVSGNGKMNQSAVLNEIDRNLASVGLSALKINPSKTRVFSHKHGVKITGIRVTSDGEIKVDRELRREIRARLHKIRIQSASTEMIAETHGLLSFVHMIDEELEENLLSQYKLDSYDW
ncbi:MAG: RNA-directed DNA polymerase [Alphaproteobacteria bacterium]|nr:MAG: RNA-directed DNA polymerase [Alphaproteobacteria bacterium]